MPLSPLDLPLIIEAVSELYSTIEHPPAENWQAPGWLTKQYQKTTAGKIPLQPGEKPMHSWLINAAKTEVLDRIMPPGHHTSEDCPEITESTLDRQHQVALIKLRNQLSTFAFGNMLASNQMESLEVLDFLGTILSQLGTLQTTTHSDDFTSINWYGIEHRFAKGLQAESVRVLWEARENKTPTMSEQTIREKVESANERFRLYHVFCPKDKRTGKRKPHPAWGTMIKSVGKGVFALSRP